MFLLVPLITISITVYILIFFIKPTYESSTTLMITDSQFVNRNMELMLPGVTQRQHEAKIIKSKVMSRVNLIELIDRMKFKEEADLQTEARARQVDFPQHSVDEIMDEMLLENLNKLIEVQNIGSEYILIKARHHQAERAYQMAQLMADIFIENSLATQLGGLQGAVEFGDQQLLIYKKKLEQAEKRLQGYEEKVKTQKIDNYTISSINLSEVNSRKISIELQIKDIREQYQTVLNSCKPEHRNFQFSPTPYIERLKMRLYDRASELAQLLTQFDWKNPQVIRLNNEIIGLKGEIGQELYKYALEQFPNDKQVDLLVKKHLIEIELTTYQRQQEEIESKLNQYKKLVASDPNTDLTRKRLQEDLDSYREVYKTLLQQQSGSQIQKALKQTEAQFLFEIIEPAFRPLKPVKPKKVQLLLIGIMLGLGVGIATVFLMEYSNDSFKTVDDVENYLGILVLGTIPKIEMKTSGPQLKNYLRLKLAISVLFFLGSTIVLLFRFL
jgi:uncharacterized protein involved in exopolysaccharide biosynthesis